MNVVKLTAIWYALLDRAICVDFGNIGAELELSYSCNVPEGLVEGDMVTLTGHFYYAKEDVNEDILLIMIDHIKKGGE